MRQLTVILIALVGISTMGCDDDENTPAEVVIATFEDYS
jgi:hypothetical protein